VKCDTVLIDEIEYIKCGEFTNQYGKFEIITPFGTNDFRISFLKVTEKNGEIEYHKVEKDIQDKLVRMYTTPEEFTGILFKLDKSFTEKIDQLDNIDDRIKNQLKETYLSIAEFVGYKGFLREKEAEEKIKTVSIEVRSTQEDDYLKENLNVAGYFDLVENCLVVRDSFVENDTLTHEVLHMFSAKNYRTSNGTLSTVGFKINPGSAFGGDIVSKELGRGINEGMTQYLTSLLYKGPKLTDAYPQNVSAARKLHFAMGDTAIEAYFRGDPELLKDEFDAVLGEQNESLKRFMIPLDAYHNAVYGKQNKEAQNLEGLQGLLSSSEDVLLEYFFEKEKMKIENGFYNSDSKGYCQRISDFEALSPRNPEKFESYREVLNRFYIESQLGTRHYSGRERQVQADVLKDIQKIYLEKEGKGSDLFSYQGARIQTENGSMEVRIGKREIWEKNQDGAFLVLNPKDAEKKNLNVRESLNTVQSAAKASLDKKFAGSKEKKPEYYNLTIKGEKGDPVQYFIVKDRASESTHLYKWSNGLEKVPLQEKQNIGVNTREKTYYRGRNTKEAYSSNNPVKDRIEESIIQEEKRYSFDKSSLPKQGRNVVSSILRIDDEEIRKALLGENFKNAYVADEDVKNNRNLVLYLEREDGSMQRISDNTFGIGMSSSRTQLPLKETFRTGGMNEKGTAYMTLVGGKTNDMVGVRKGNCRFAFCRNDEGDIKIGRIGIDAEGKSCFNGAQGKRIYENIWKKSKEQKEASRA